MAHKRQPNSRMPETALYGPVKRYLEALGFTVKGEVCGCDLVALRGDEPPMVVIGELKLAFSLDLVLQAVDRTAACDEVWLAVECSRARTLARSACAHALPSSWFRIARSIVRWRGRSACRSPGRGARAKTGDAVLGWFMNIAAGLEILLWADRRNSRS